MKTYTVGPGSITCLCCGYATSDPDEVADSYCAKCGLQFQHEPETLPGVFFGSPVAYRSGHSCWRCWHGLSPDERIVEPGDLVECHDCSFARE